MMHLNSFSLKTMTKNQFLTTIMSEFYASMHRIEEDNFDLFRNQKAMERNFDAARHINFSAFFFENYDQFYTTFALFNDRESRALFIKLILFRLLGHNHINVNGRRWADIEKGIEAVNKYSKGKSTIDANILGLDLHHFEKYPFMDRTIDIDSVDLNIVYGEVLGQYYYNRNGLKIQVEPGDVVIDAGTCMGETTTFFAAAAGKDGFVHGFDMLPLHLSLTQHNIDQNGFTDNAKIVGLGVSNATQGQEVQPDLSNTAINPSLALQGQGAGLPTITIDDYVRQENLTSVDFIKMDIEGAELSALHGAVETMRKFKPKLAISIYHLHEDYVTIPQFLKGECPFYDFHLDHYTIFDQETVLYAIAK